MKRHVLRYWRHGSPVELEGLLIMQGQARTPISTWTDPRGKVHTAWDVQPAPVERLWRVRVAGKVVDRALTLRRARYLAEMAARRELLTPCSRP